jgi:hypothetical protein
MFIVVGQYRISAPSGAAWKPDMSPSTGLFSLSDLYYKHAAPNGPGLPQCCGEKLRIPVALFPNKVG